MWLLIITPVNTTYTQTHMHTQQYAHLLVKALFDFIDLFHSLVSQYQEEVLAHMEASNIVAFTREAK